MAKSKPVRNRRKPQPVRRKTRPLWNAAKRIARRVFGFASRVPWIAFALVLAAFVALVTVESSVAGVIHDMAADPISGVIFVASALLASAGVIFGPMVARSMRNGSGQQKMAWRIVVFCFALSIWNLSATLANAHLQMKADAVRSSPMFAEDQARLVVLNRRVDALSMDVSPEAGVLLNNVVAERDLISVRIADANPAPVMFAWEDDGWVFWAKAGLFHLLVAGFTSAFTMPVKARRRRQLGKRGSSDERMIDDGKVVALAQF